MTNFDVLTLWFKLVVQREMQGECFLVNFADDFVAGFQYKSEAERYYKELKERMEKFGLELESSKSRRIEFRRFAEQNRRGCRRAYTWNGFVEMLKYYPLAKPKTYYCLYRSECYYEEPYAGKPHVRICEGLGLRGLSLLDYGESPL